ncbi:MAG: hypothetical protein JWR16_128 [Nevskia sp.]|nr:hypothetical protein [Nevskia sp.]
MANERQFELRGCRELLSSYPDSLPIQEAIAVIERSFPNEPGAMLTHCRGIFETVCRTILADRGVECGHDPKPNWLMSEALKTVKLTPETFDNDSSVNDGVRDVLGGLNRLLNGVVALRNSQGVGPHGRDALEAVLDSSYAELVAQATDSAIALLYRLHRKQAENDPLKRFKYGDHPDFDRYIDENNRVVIEDTPILASRALYHAEVEAYRQKLVEFRLRPGTEPIAEGEDFKEGEATSESRDG